MNQVLILVWASLGFCTALDQPSENEPKKIWASVGTLATLPCTFTESQPTTVEWSKDGKIAIVFRDDKELYPEKNSDFDGRTSFSMKGMRPKNFFLRLSGVQLSDAGDYQCKGLWGEERKENITVKLVVDAEPRVECGFVPGPSEAVILECEARSWQSKLNIIFLEDGEKEMKAEEQRWSREEGGYHTVKRRLTLQLQHKSLKIICRVQLPENNTSIDKDVFIPGPCLTPCSTCSTCVVIAVVLAVSVLGTVLALGLVLERFRPGFFSCVTFCLRPEDSKPTPSTENSVNQRTEEISALRSELKNKNLEVQQARHRIRELTEENTKLEAQLENKDQFMAAANDCIQPGAAVPHLDQPTMVDQRSSSKPSSNSIQKKKQRSLPTCSQTPSHTKSKDHNTTQDPPTAEKADLKPKRIFRSMSLDRSDIRSHLIPTLNRFQVLAEHGDDETLLK